MSKIPISPIEINKNPSKVDRGYTGMWSGESGVNS